MCLAQVELPLDPPAGVILELALAIGRVDELPLRPDQPQFHGIALIDERGVRVIIVAPVFHMPKALTVELAYRRQHLFGQLALARQLLELRECRLDGRTSCPE